MKIALVSEHASPLATLGGEDAGGQNVYVSALAVELGRQGHEITVYTRRDSAGLPDRMYLTEAVAVEHLRAGPERMITKDLLLPHMPEFGAELRQRWRIDPPHVVHSHFWMSGIAALAATAGINIPIVHTFHALGIVKRRHQGENDRSPKERIRLERNIGRSVELVAATCTDEVNELIGLGIPRDRIRVVPCGVDIATFTPDGPALPRGKAVRLLYLGRLVERKRIDTIVRALPGIADAELIIAGGPPAAQLTDDANVRRLRLIAEKCGVQDQVLFLGNVAHVDVPKLIRSADLVVNVPPYEPFGMVPVEAMACGVPVVVSPIGGHLDTVVDGKTGIYVSGDQPEELARRITDLLDEPARYHELASQAAERTRALYSWGRVAKEMLRVYRHAMSATMRIAG
ncbi:glycosyltransferase [Nonomuraea insulae]|uniref:Glycosyltransferase n=1 Tax=Nonomuraea insulae TaxID=1616787 RepID=A0ABW1D906_9ACTN